MIKINSKTGLMLIASCGAALGLVGVSFLNNASTKVYATGGTTTKSVVYDGTHNKASGEGIYYATADASMNMTGLYTNITKLAGQPDYNASGVFETVGSFYNSQQTSYQHSISQSFNMTTSGSFTSVDIVFSCSHDSSNGIYLPFVTVDEGSKQYFVTTYTANTTTTKTISGLSGKAIKVCLMFYTTAAFTFTLTSLTVHFTSATTC